MINYLKRIRKNKVGQSLHNLTKTKYFWSIFFLSLFTLLFSWLAIRRYHNLDASMFDFGLAHQVIWNTSHGRILQSGVEVDNYLGDHFSLILLPIALIYKMFPSVYTLFILQNIAIAIGAFGIYKLAYSFLKSKLWASIWMLLFCFYPGISGLMLYDFHAISFSVPFLIWGIYSYHRKKPFWLTIFLFLMAMICKEDVGLFVGMFGLLMILRKDYYRGFFLMTAGFVTSFTALFVILPYFRGGASDTISRYDHLGSGPLTMIKTILTKPKYIYDYVMTMPKRNYLGQLGRPLYFLFLLAPLELILILPHLAINLLSKETTMTDLSFQYQVTITIGLFYAGIIGVSRLGKGKPKYVLITILQYYKNGIGGLMDKFFEYVDTKHFSKSKMSAKKRWGIGRVYILYGIHVMLALSILVNTYNHQMWRWLTLDHNKREVYDMVIEMKKKIPEGTVLSTTCLAGSVFGDREHLQLFKLWRLEYDVEPDYILFYDGDFMDPGNREEFYDLIGNGYEVVEEGKGVVLIKRVE